MAFALAGHENSSYLYRIMNAWTNHIANGKVIDVLYLDLQKTFDKVPHAHLISKLDANGIRGQLLV